MAPAFSTMDKIKIRTTDTPFSSESQFLFICPFFSIIRLGFNTGRRESFVLHSIGGKRVFDQFIMLLIGFKLLLISKNFYISTFDPFWNPIVISIKSNISIGINEPMKLFVGRKNCRFNRM